MCSELEIDEGLNLRCFYLNHKIDYYRKGKGTEEDSFLLEHANEPFSTDFGHEMPYVAQHNQCEHHVVTIDYIPEKLRMEIGEDAPKEHPRIGKALTAEENPAERNEMEGQHSR